MLRTSSSIMALALSCAATPVAAQSGDVVIMRNVLPGRLESYSPPGSTPTPTPGTPTGSPTPTPGTPGGTPAPSPTPTPTPASTPAPTPAPTPADGAQWTDCGGEGQSCDFVGTTSVRYGTGSTFATQNASNGVTCSYQIFGDPAPGVAKHCQYDARYAVPADWVNCADYGATCTVPARAVVRMGAAGYYLKRTVNGSVPCTVDAFGGDPYYGGAKACQYVVLPTSTQPVPTGTPGTVTSIVVKAGIVNSCIQVAELEVYSGGVNVALSANGGDADGSPPYSGQSTPDKANDGVRPSSYPDIYHSQCGGGDYLRISFAKPVKVDSITLYGRVGLAERDVYSYVLYSGSTPSGSGQVDARSGSGTSVPQ